MGETGFTVVAIAGIAVVVVTAAEATVTTVDVGAIRVNVVVVIGKVLELVVTGASVVTAGAV